jgi:hypothetical protein
MGNRKRKLLSKASPGRKVSETLSQRTSWVRRTMPAMPATQESEVGGSVSKTLFEK